LSAGRFTYETVMAQLAGDCKGYFLMGENPAVGSANAKMRRRGMANLEWLVVRDFSPDRKCHRARLARLHEAGVADARLYGRDPQDGVGGDGAFFLLLDKQSLRVAARPGGDHPRSALDVETRCGRGGDVGRWGAGGVRHGKATVMSDGLRGAHDGQDNRQRAQTNDGVAGGAGGRATAPRPSQPRSSPPTTTSQ
jgi:hypothetical protein